MAATHLIEILLNIVPSPLISSELTPIIEGSGTAWEPSVVVKTTASSEDLAAGVRLLDTSVFLAVDHAGLVLPVILATTKLKGTSWGGDCIDVLRVSNTCFDDKYIDLGVFCKTASYNAT